MRHTFGPKPKSPILNLRKDGDTARDRRDWAAAGDAYRGYLNETPYDRAIWVQYGHVMKEQGKLDDAVLAYERASTLDLSDADAGTHLGHLLKRLNRRSEAAKVFHRVWELTASKEIYDELVSLLGEETPVLRSTSRSTSDDLAFSEVVYLELNDLLNYLHAHKTLSGIQRVQVSVVDFILRASSSTVKSRYQFVLNEPERGGLWALSNDDLEDIIAYVTGSFVDHALLRDMLHRSRLKSRQIIISTNQCLFVLGSFWGYESLGARYLPLKKAGLKIGAFIYDLIPITNAEFCDARLAHDFMLSFGDAAYVFDFFLSISDYTKKEMSLLLEKTGIGMLPTAVVRLAHTNLDELGSHQDDWSSAIEAFKNRSFVLYVSTIEGRKNHAYLVAVWRAMLDEGLDPPDLVFVGRTGWRVETLLDQLRSTQGYDGRITILNDLSDSELNTLYRNCRFTAFPSFVEGWGLPVGESLSHGKPCIASETSSIREVAEEFADYIDPYNIRSGIEAFKRMCFDDGYLEKRSLQIRSKFRPRPWKEVGQMAVQIIEQLHKSTSSQSRDAVLLPAGLLFEQEELCFPNAIPRNYIASPKRLMLSDGWYGIEPGQCWMRGSRASITFRTELAPGTDVYVYLKLCGAPWANTNKIEVWIHNSGDAVRERSKKRKTSPVRIGPFFCRVAGLVDANASVTVNLRLQNDIARGEDVKDLRNFACGIVSFGYAAKADLARRLDITDIIIEQITI